MPSFPFTFLSKYRAGEIRTRDLLNPIKIRGFPARSGRGWHSAAQLGIMSRKASVAKGLRAVQVRHKQAQSGTRFFHRGYHRGYHGLPQHSAVGRDDVSGLEPAFKARA